MSASEHGGNPSRQLSLTVRPRVPMHYLQGVPWIAALGIAEALRSADHGMAGVVWPHDVAVDDSSLRISSRGGYDEDGMFVQLNIDVEGALASHPDEALLSHAVVERVSSWERDVAEGRSQAGPLGSVLSRYFDLMPLMGQEVTLCYPNGRVFDSGRLAGLDAWGRAVIVRADGRELELAPEQARIRAQE